MININGKLRTISQELYIGRQSDERTKIKRLKKELHRTLQWYFDLDINETFTFGSIYRDTKLPQKYDPHSDIDIMVIFDDSETRYKPETYRERLRRFAQRSYPNCKDAKDHPSITLVIEGIKFDLVPGIWKNRFLRGGSYYIPDSDNGWQKTSPGELKETLVYQNQRYDQIVRPIIRLLKRWNSVNKKPFSSWELESQICSMDFSGDNHQMGFLYAIEQLDSYDLPYYKSDRVDILKNDASWLLEYINRENEAQTFKRLGKILDWRIT